MTDVATRMRDAGRSWTEIADKLGVSVPEVKSRVAPDKQDRRVKLSHSAPAENRNGLRDLCTCSHMRKQHDGLTGECRVCGPMHELWEVNDYTSGERNQYFVREEPTPPEGTAAYEWSAYSHLEGCEEYVHPGTRLLPWWRVPKLDPQHPSYVEPDVRLSDRLENQAWQLGLPYRRKGPQRVPTPTLKVQARRARKRLKQGKPVKIKRGRNRWE